MTGQQKRAKVLKDGRIICPDCGRYFAKAGYGARAKNIEFWCRNCKKTVTLYLSEYA